MLERILRHLTPDRIHASEDMAHEHKSMIFPAMVREFLMPCWRRWCEQIRSAGVPIVDMDSDGYVGELIPLWIEAGFNVCDPVEATAGNDLPACRRRLGRATAYTGGMDKRATPGAGRPSGPSRPG